MTAFLCEYLRPQQLQPHLCPLLPPLKRALAHLANLGGQVGLIESLILCWLYSGLAGGAENKSKIHDR